MSWWQKFLLQIVIGIFGLWLATLFVPGVEFQGRWQNLLLGGLVLGSLNYFVKPILKKITWPLRILTLNLFSFVINMGIVWAVDIFFAELIIKGLVPLFWTTMIIWGLGVVLPILVPILVPKKTVLNSPQD